MKKSLAIVITALLLTSVIILPVSAEDNAVTEEYETINLNAYFRYFVGYVHGPYSSIDDIECEGILGMLYLFCYSNADILDFITINEISDGRIEVSADGDHFRGLAKALLGESFYPSKYHDVPSYGKYNAETDTYVWGMNVDHWGADNYSLKWQSTPKITETNDAVTIVADICTGREANDYNGSYVEDYLYTLEYKFNKVVYEGVLLYQLDTVTIVENAPQTGFSTAALAIAALISCGYVASKKRR